MKIAACILILMVSGGVLFAEDVTINGTVVNRSGSAVAGATVTLLPGNIATTTKDDGSFSFDETSVTFEDNLRSVRSGYQTPSVERGKLSLYLKKRTGVRITVFSLRGEVVDRIAVKAAVGKNVIRLPYRGTGVYIYHIQAGADVYTIKGTVLSTIDIITKHSRDNGISAMEMTTASSETTPAEYTIIITKDGYIDNSVTIKYDADYAPIKITTVESEGTVTDIDGNVYQTIRIGNQVWTVENLRTTRFNDEEPIPLVTDTSEWGDFNIYNRENPKNGDPVPQFCFYNNTTNEDTIQKFGALYNWYVVKTGKLAPEGWHVPDTAEWLELRDYLLNNPFQTEAADEFDLVVKSMAAGIYWNDTLAERISNDFTANNISGFSAIPAGYRTGTSMILYMLAGERGYWWSSTEKHPECPCMFTLFDFLGECNYLAINDAGFGMSVRLIKDSVD